MKGKVSFLNEDIPQSASSLRLDILKWQAHLYDICPGLQAYLDDSEIADAAEDIKLCLPSDFTVEDRLKYALKHQAASELKLRQGEAFDIIGNLRTALRLMAQHNHKAKKHGGARVTKTRTGKAYSEARKLKLFWKSEYDTVYSAMLSLGLASTDNVFRPLVEEDLYRPDNLEPAEFCAKEIGWIWTVTGTGGISTHSSILEWEKEGEFIDFCTYFILLNGVS